MTIHRRKFLLGVAASAAAFLPTVKAVAASSSYTWAINDATGWATLTYAGAEGFPIAIAVRMQELVNTGQGAYEKQLQDFVNSPEYAYLAKKYGRQGRSGVWRNSPQHPVNLATYIHPQQPQY